MPFLSRLRLFSPSFPPKRLLSCHFSQALAPKLSLPALCSLISQSLENGDRALQSLHLPIISPDQAMAAVAALAATEGSMTALSFFHWTIAQPKFKHYFQLYVTTASSLVSNGNFEKAQQVMRCMVEKSSEAGRLKEAVDMVFEMGNHGLPLCVHTMNRILMIGVDSGSVQFADMVFDEMTVRGVSPNATSFKTMVTGFCREGEVSKVERLLRLMEERGLCVDNVTCTLVVDLFCKKGLFGRVRWLFDRMSEMGSAPNVINYTAVINGLAKKGSVKQSFQV